MFDDPGQKVSFSSYELGWSSKYQPIVLQEVSLSAHFQSYFWRTWLKGNQKSSANNDLGLSMFEEYERMCPVPIRMGSSQALAPHKKYLIIVMYVYIYIYCITWYTYVVHLSVVGVCAHKYRQSLMTSNSTGKVYFFIVWHICCILCIGVSLAVALDIQQASKTLAPPPCRHREWQTTIERLLQNITASMEGWRMPMIEIPGVLKNEGLGYKTVWKRMEKIQMTSRFDIETTWGSTGLEFVGLWVKIRLYLPRDFPGLLVKLAWGGSPGEFVLSLWGELTTPRVRLISVWSCVCQFGCCDISFWHVTPTMASCKLLLAVGGPVICNVV